MVPTQPALHGCWCLKASMFPGGPAKCDEEEIRFADHLVQDCPSHCLQGGWQEACTTSNPEAPKTGWVPIDSPRNSFLTFTSHMKEDDEEVLRTEKIFQTNKRGKHRQRISSCLWELKKESFWTYFMWQVFSCLT